MSTSHLGFHKKNNSKAEPLKKVIIPGNQSQRIFQTFKTYKATMLRFVECYQKEQDLAKKKMCLQRNKFEWSEISKNKMEIHTFSELFSCCGKLKKGMRLSFRLKNKESLFNINAEIREVKYHCNSFEVDLKPLYYQTLPKKIDDILTIMQVSSKIPSKRMQNCINELENSDFFLLLQSYFFNEKYTKKNYLTPYPLERGKNFPMTLNQIQGNKFECLRCEELLDEEEEDKENVLNIQLVKNLSGYNTQQYANSEYDDRDFSTTVSRCPTTRCIHLKSDIHYNYSQMNAVEAAMDLSNYLTLIQGPPGTGKTATIFKIVFELYKKHPNARILITAPSNYALDHLVQKIHREGIPVLRVYAKSYEIEDEFEATLAEINLDNIVERKITNEYGIKNNIARNFAKYKEIETQIISGANIVACTCNMAGDFKFSNLQYDYVIIDEAAQCFEMDSLIPLIKCKKKLILCGDHKQLGPYSHNVKGSDPRMFVSLFERLSYLIAPIVLDTQYRMHPKIAEFPSREFYQGKLKSGTKFESFEYPWENTNVPCYFYNIHGEESGLKGLYYNANELSFIEEILIPRMQNAGIKLSTIGILTFYSSQKQYFYKNCKFGELEVFTVDEFQGKEKDYIILSCVRANQHKKVGFLKDKSRINVSLTRAKNGLIICGNKETLKHNSVWERLIWFYEERNSLIGMEKNK